MFVRYAHAQAHRTGLNSLKGGDPGFFNDDSMDSAAQFSDSATLAAHYRFGMQASALKTA
jgi:hypothetical protein